MSTKDRIHSPDGPASLSGSRLLFSDATYGPENLKAICQAFDRAWEAIAPIVDNTALAQEAARLKLANMILSVASNDKVDQVRTKPVS